MCSTKKITSTLPQRHINRMNCVVYHRLFTALYFLAFLFDRIPRAADANAKPIVFIVFLILLSFCVVLSPIQIGNVWRPNCLVTRHFPIWTPCCV